MPHYRLYTDGGVIQKNPSPIAGTWAYVKTDQHNEMISCKKGILLPIDVFSKPVTNNQTELLAALYALQSIDRDDTATIFSDSAVTLGRIFNSYRWKNIPPWMHDIFRQTTQRLQYWSVHQRFGGVLLAGHPTRKELAVGKGRNGFPVSKWNVRCDELCGEAASEHLARMVV